MAECFAKVQEEMDSFQQTLKDLHELSEELTYNSETVRDHFRETTAENFLNRKAGLSYEMGDVLERSYSLGTKVQDLQSELDDVSKALKAAKEKHKETVSLLKETRKAFFQYAKDEVHSKRRKKLPRELAETNIDEKALDKINVYLENDLCLSDVE